MVTVGHRDLVETRVDRWLHAVRVVRTRAMATEACRGGHVRVNGAPAKASTPVRVGDRVVVGGSAGPRDLEVVRVIERRVGAAVAATCVVDHTPPPAPRGERPAPVARRERGAGRPTKKERRQIDRLRGRR